MQQEYLVTLLQYSLWDCAFLVYQRHSPLECERGTVELSAQLLDQFRDAGTIGYIDREPVSSRNAAIIGKKLDSYAHGLSLKPPVQVPLTAIAPVTPHSS